jgi:hypothetical protein
MYLVALAASSYRFPMMGFDELPMIKLKELSHFRFRLNDLKPSHEGAARFAARSSTYNAQSLWV